MISLHSVYSQAFLGESSKAEPSTPSSPTPDTSWCYSPERHGTIADFIRHPDYAPFAERVEHDINTLLQFSAGMPDTVEDLKSFRQKFFDHDGRAHLSYGEAEVPLMYGTGAQYLDQLARLIPNETLSPQSRLTELRQLGPQLLVCAPGTIEALQCCLGRLDPERVNLTGKFRSTVEQIVEQVAVDAVEITYGEDFHEAVLAQRHYVAGLKLKLYEALELPWPLPKDRFSHDDHADDLVQRCAASLREALAPGAVVRVFADEYVTRFAEAMRDRQRKAGATTAPTATDIEACTAALNAEFGPPPPLDALMRQSDDTGLYEPVPDATLAAVHFLDRLREVKVLNPDHQVRTLASWSRPAPGGIRAEHSHLRSIDGLAWVAKDGLKLPIDAADLKHVTSAELRPPMVMAAIANSSSGELETLVEPHWLLNGEIGDRLLGRLGMDTLGRLIARWQAAGSWPEDLGDWWAQAKAAGDPDRPPPGRLAWSDARGQHQLDPAQFHDLLKRREEGQLSTDALRTRLSDLLTMTLAEPKPQPLRDGLRIPQETPTRRRQMPVTEPVRLWWGAIGGALRADPPRLTPEELVDVLTTADSASFVPLVRCLSVADNDIRHVFMQGLTELQRDGFLPTDRLIDRLTSAEVAPDGCIALLTSLSPRGIKALFEFATMATVDGHLQRERCRHLFFGTVPETSAWETLPFALFRAANATGRSSSSPLSDYFSAQRHAALRGVIEHADLLQLMGHEFDAHPVALAWANPPKAGEGNAPNAALYAWLEQTVRLYLDGQLSLDEAQGLLLPPETPEQRRWGGAGTVGECQLVFNTIDSLCPAISSRTRPRPPEPEDVVQRRRELLQVVVGVDGRTPCRFIRHLREVAGADTAADAAHHVQFTMARLNFSAAAIAAATGDGDGDRNSA